MLTLFLSIVQIFALTSDIIGETYSNSESQSTSSITYKLASVQKYTISDPSSWVSPKIVDDLSLAVSDGPIINKADPVPTDTQYYDGSSNLSSSSLKCRLMVSMKSCFTANSCGWCKSLGRCIPGNSEGPLYPCDEGAYVYSN